MNGEYEALTWLEHDAPLILLSGANLAEWEGIDPPSGGRVVEASFRWSDEAAPATDYDRACDINDYVGLISVGSGMGLILNDMPMDTAWKAFGGNRGGLFIRCMYADSMAAVLSAVHKVPAESWEAAGLIFTVDGGPLYLFDSTYNGKDLSNTEYLVIQMSPGNYSIETAVYENESAGIVLHRFLPV
jgi:hypothetical protein